MLGGLLRVALIVGLVGLLVNQWRNPPPVDIPAPGSEGVAPGEVIIQPLPELGPVEAFAVVNERPLFLPERRPPAPGVEAPPPVEQDEFALQGVMMLPGGSTAILRVINRNESVRLREGETLAGWTVIRIEAERVLLERGGGAETQTLPLLRNRSLFQPVPPTGAVNGVAPGEVAEPDPDPMDETAVLDGRSPLPDAENGSSALQEESHDE